VIYTAEDTKIRRNAGAAPSKKSAVDRQLDRVLIILLCFLFLMSFVSGLVGYILEKEGNCPWYRGCGGGHATAWCPSGPVARILFLSCSFLLIYMYMVPIALYVSGAMVKVFQVPFNVISTPFERHFNAI
jgi:magnesium-transporting ATPase (P-type)